MLYKLSLIYFIFKNYSKSAQYSNNMAIWAQTGKCFLQLVVTIYYSLHPAMIVYNFVDIFLNQFHWLYCEKYNYKKVPNFISLESIKNIACILFNLNKISHNEVFFWPTQNNFKRTWHSKWTIISKWREYF